MVLRKMLSGRLFHLTKHSFTRASLPPPPTNLLRRSISQSEAGLLPTSIRNARIGDNLLERIRSSMTHDRIRNGEFAPPLPVKEEEDERSKKERALYLRKMLMAWRMENVRAMLRGIPSSYVSHSEFLNICRNAAAGEDECAREIAAALDRSGSVIVVADVVFLRPDQVGRAIEKVMGSVVRGEEEGRRKELEELEAKKDAIDGKAVAMAKRELWGGLVFVLIQTVGFMRLTFWELSWDVMEPICFFTTSAYFMLGYAFFLRTAKEPSFESFFSARFAANQKRLIKAHSFDLAKFNHLKTPLFTSSSSSSSSSS